MGRQSLRIVLVLGVLVSLVGGTGIFATFTDRATGGTNVIQSSPRQAAADLKIEPGSFPGSGAIDCDLAEDGQQWTHDGTTTPAFQLQILDPGVAQIAYICLKNVGSGTLDVTASAIDLVDLDIACTADEAANGDATCGLDGNDSPQVGELSGQVKADIDVVACNNQSITVQDNDPAFLDEYTAAPTIGGGAATPMAPNAVACLKVVLDYPFDAPEAGAQVAQSDKVTWRFAFDGTAR
jgi:hypothetical protein